MAGILISWPPLSAEVYVSETLLIIRIMIGGSLLLNHSY